MCTVSITYDKNNKQASDMLSTILASGLFQINELSEKKDCVYIENGEVKLDFAEEVTDLEDFRDFLHEMVELEYSLP